MKDNSRLERIQRRDWSNKGGEKTKRIKSRVHEDARKETEEQDYAKRLVFPSKFGEIEGGG